MTSILRPSHLQKTFIFLMLLLSVMTYGKQIPTVVGIMKTGPAFVPNVSIGSSFAMNTIMVPVVPGSTDYDVRNTISLKYDLSSEEFLQNQTDVTVEVQIDRWDATGVPFPTLTRILNISVNNYLNRPILEESSVNLLDGYQVTVTITQIWIHGSPVSSLPRYVSVESEINLDRYYDFSSASATIPYNTKLDPLDNDCDGIPDEVELTWSVPSAIPEEYQVEWYYVNNYARGSGFYPPSAFVTDFRNNSTRITTMANSCKISLLYPDGYLVCRVRAVGRDHLNPSDYVYSSWNLPDQVNLGTLSPLEYYTISGHDIIKNWQYSGTFAEEGKKKEIMSYFDGSQRNRQTVTKINSDKHVIVGETIYDFQGRPAVNVLPVPTPLSCPAPGSESVIRYHENFNVNSAQSFYSKTDFDYDLSGVCLPWAAPMDTSSGASNYYSNDNPDKDLQQAYLPHARRYPFTHTEYTPDNTGRIRSQSGAGKEFQLGSGRETKYLYGQPNQIQIDRLFGSEAGDASHYKKNITIDPNGQSSVSYLNQEGQTIATALAGVPPSNNAANPVFLLDSLDYAGQNQKLFTVDLFNKNALGHSVLNSVSSSNDALVFSTQLLVPFRSSYDFRYTLEVPTLPDACLKTGICVSCIYDLEIQVKDECGADLISSISPFSPVKRVTGHVDTSGNKLSFNTNCLVPIHKDSSKVSLILQPGMYTVNKILRVNSEARDFYVQQYIDTAYNSCVQNLRQFRAAELATIDTSDCYVDCASCLSTLGDRDDFVASGKGTAEQWDFLADQCNAPCRNKTMCQNSYEIMLSDVSPGGQYGKFQPNTYNTSSEPLSVFNPDNLLRPNLLSNKEANWRYPMLLLNNNVYRMYLDENGIRTRVPLSEPAPGQYQPAINDPSLVYLDKTSNQKYTFPENLLHLSDFITIWHANYARSLVVFHPEYAYYISCSNQSLIYPGDHLSSDGLDSLLLATDNFSQAVANGFINGNWSTSTAAINKIAPIWQNPALPVYDPFFTNGTFQYLTTPNSVTGSKTTLAMGFNLQTEMNNIVTNYKSGYSMADVAAYIARCGNNFGTSTPPGSCLDFGLNVTTPGNPMNDSIRNKEWRIFRQLYLSEKQKLQFKRMDFYAKHHDEVLSDYYGGCNACIGNSGMNVFSSGMVTLSGIGMPNPYPQSAFFDLSQPCGQGSYTHYSNVTKRFYDPDNTGLNTDVTGALYNMTGQCPLAFSLQNFLNAMATQSLLAHTAPVPLNSIPEFGIDLYSAINNGIGSNHTNYNWMAGTTHPILIGSIYDPVTFLSKCAIWLDVTGTAIPSFSNIIGINQLVFAPNTGHSGAFNAIAVYVVGSSTLSANITGTSSCMDFENCVPDAECRPNQFASDMVNLLSYLQASGKLRDSTGIYLNGDPSLTHFITPAISSILGSSWINYQFIAPDKLTFYDMALGPNTRLILTYSVTPSAQAANIKTFANFKNFLFSHSYTMDGLDINGQVIASVSGIVTKVTGTGNLATVQKIDLGSCSPEDQVNCGQKEHKVRENVEALMNEVLTRKPFSGNVNLYNLSHFSPLLKSYLPQNIVSTSSTYTFSTNTSPSFDSLNIRFPDLSCSLKFYQWNSGSTPYNFSNIVGLSDLIGIGSPDIAGNYYQFKALATYDLSGTTVRDTIFGSSCWPIKNCNVCVSFPITTTTLSTAFDRTNNIPYNGSNNGNFDPWWEVVQIQPLDSTWAPSGSPILVNQLAFDIHLSSAIQFMDAGYINHISNSNSSSSLVAVTYKTEFTLPNPLPANNSFSLSINARSDDFIKRITLNGKDFFTGIAGGAYSGPPLGVSAYLPDLVAGTNTLEIEAADVGLTRFGMAAEVVLTEYEKSPCNNRRPAPDSAFVFPPYTSHDNPCVQQKINLAYQNADLKYQQYINNIITTFADNYNKHCLSALEQFTYKYVDKEYHHTLYYYDQAGNLTKTVPPEGIEYLPITSYTDPLARQINYDRTHAKQTVFTEHRMATKYLYNSLNQLTYQSVPDHDNMDICDGLNPNGLDTGLVINAIQFTDASRGYLCGHIRRAGLFNRGYLYTTGDGGNSWKRVSGVSSGDLQKVQFVSASVGYAISTYGMIFKTSDAGNTWDLLTTLYTSLSPRYTDLLNGLCFNGIFGLVGGIMQTGSSSAIFYTNNAGGSWSAASVTGLATGDTITSISFDGSGIYVASSRNGLSGKIFTSVNGTNWSQANTCGNNLTKVQFINTGMAYAIGEDGTLLKMEVSIPSGGPIFQLVPTGMTGKFTDVYFKNQDQGVAIIDSAVNKGRIYRTQNGGLSWEPLSKAGEYYHSLKLYEGSSHKLIAGGKNGLLAKVLLNTLPFGITKIGTPNTDPVSYADAYDAGNNGLFAVGVSDQSSIIYTCYDAHLAYPSWTAVNTTLVANSPIPQADAMFSKVLLQASSPGSPILQGILLTTNGKLYSFYRTFNSSTLICGLVSPPGTYFNDITNNDPSGTAPVFAFDTIAKQNYRITFTGSTAGITAIGNTNPLTRNVSSIDMSNTSNDILLVGSSGHISYAANINTPGWTDISTDVIPVPVTRAAAISAGEFILVGIDGAVWRNAGGISTWYLKNSGTAEKLASVAVDNTGSGLVCGDHGKLFRLTSAQTQQPGLIPANTGVSDPLTDVALNPSGTDAYVTTRSGQVLYMANYTAPSITVAAQVSSFPVNGVSFRPGGTSAVIVGDRNLISDYFATNALVNKEIYTRGLISTHFFDANNGFVIDSSNVIRRTSDGGNTWSVILPFSGSPLLTRVFATRPNEGTLIGLNRLAAAISGNTMSQLSVPGSIPAGTHFYDINYNDSKNTGFIVGSGSHAARITGLSITALGQAVAVSPPDFRTVHVFNNTSFIAAGTKGAVYYYKNGSFTQQDNYTPPPGHSKAVITLKDIVFHDFYTGYMVGSNGTAYRLSLTDSIGNLGTSANTLPWTPFCPGGIYMGSTSYPAIRKLDFNAIAFPGRNLAMLGGADSNVVIGSFTPNRYARLLKILAGDYSSRFWYDKLGRLVLSQNSRQYNKTNPSDPTVTQAFSYTLYDPLGRITEVGEKYENHGGAPQLGSIFGSFVNGLYNNNAIDEGKFSVWIGGPGDRREVTSTYYDEQHLLNSAYPQANLRKRVTSTSYEEFFDGNDLSYDHATHYSYDIHGNVKSLWQENPQVGVSGEELKRIDYSYDLISGKVNKVIYAHGHTDQFIHRYSYDADNRITMVETSSDDLRYDLDAKYFYYAHGPLARVEYGKAQVQGMDYAYTLQGWIKGVNSNVLKKDKDMGHDGDRSFINPNGYFARDIAGYTLNYYEHDYEAIDFMKWNTASSRFEAYKTGSDILANNYDLYNGNISSMVTSISQTDSTPSGQVIGNQAFPMGHSYRYDQLHRLKQAIAFDNLDTLNNTWISGGSTPGIYRNTFRYDANGNILNQVRRDSIGGIIDSLVYHYETINGKTRRNRLYHVNDHITGPATGPGDLTDQGTFTPGPLINNSNNYSFDETGNLVKDLAEEIDEIQWTVYGKIKAIIRQSGSAKDNLSFDYDASGNRIAKHLYSSGGSWIKSTYYLRDAQGNIMSLYEKQIDPINTTMSYMQKENHLYGSSRLGVYAANLELLGWGGPPASNKNYFLGKKSYEISNHLGNVLSVFSDKKIAVQDQAMPSAIDHYVADMISATDYYAFGSPMPGRQFNSSDYRYGFNGKENDNEVKGTGNQQDYGMRIYDPRLGRFLSVDPLTKTYPWYTPYQFAGNKPIGAIDVDGLEEYWVTMRSFIPQPKLTNPDPFSITVYPNYAGDNRTEYKANAGKSFRTEQYANLDFNKKTTATNQFANGTTAITSDGQYIKGSKGSEDAGNVQAKMMGNTASANFVIDSKNELAASRNPFTPAINAKVDVGITPKEDGSFDYSVDIPEMDGFPAYELWINDDKGNSYLLFGRNPLESKESPFSLYGSGEHKYKLSGNSSTLESKPVQSFEERKNPVECTDCQE
jgi:RHS repeat-associated protein